MQRIVALVLFGLAVVALSAACTKGPPPAQVPTPSAQPAFSPPTAGESHALQSSAPPGQPGPPAPGRLSPPGPIALACQNDSQCLTHRCNTQYQKCAFPCQSDTDCVQGTTCLLAGGTAAWCMPKPSSNP